jgi:hypothetical protein
VATTGEIPEGVGNFQKRIFLRGLPIPSHHPVEQLPEGSRKPMEIFSRGFASIPVKN